MSEEIPKPKPESNEVIKAAEKYVRDLAVNGDLTNKRVRRALARSLAELERMRQIFVSPTTEMGELAPVRKRQQGSGYVINELSALNPSYNIPSAIPESLFGDNDDLELGDPTRDQEPNYPETFNARLSREVMKALPTLIDLIPGMVQGQKARVDAETARVMLDAAHLLNAPKASEEAKQAARKVLGQFEEESKKNIEAYTPEN